MGKAWSRLLAEVFVSSQYRGSPRKCIETRPTPQSVLFCDKFINLSLIALRTNISISHLSMLFSGKRQPSLKTAKLIALALNMSFHAFVSQLEKHSGTMKPYLRIPTKKSTTHKPDNKVHPKK